MKILLCLMALTMSTQVLAQVKENIRQKVVISTDNPTAEQTSQPVAKVRKKGPSKGR